LARASYRNRLRRRKKSLVPLPQMLESPSEVPPSIPLETVSLLRRAIEKLPARERSVILLRYFDDGAMGPESIAERLGWSTGCVRSLLFRAQKRLARSISRTGAYGEIRVLTKPEKFAGQ
jgi:RNA polymerase sigma factor (sigma-70 family)